MAKHVHQITRDEHNGSNKAKKVLVTGAGRSKADPLYVATIDPSATNVSIADTGGYYTGTEVETALQEIADGTLTFDAVNVNGAVTKRELSSDPSDPPEGSFVEWMSDGTGTGNDGDVICKVTFGGTTYTYISPLNPIKNIWIPADGIRAPGTKPASFVLHGLKGAWEFADAGAGNEETVSGSVKLPAEMDKTVAPSFYIGWSANGVSPGDCEWQFEYLYVTANSDTTAGAEETLTVTSTASSTSNGLIVEEVTGMNTPGATDKAIFWKITRLSDDANDTISDTVEMHGNYFEYTSDRLGG